jgi:Protein of unknown function (DUF2848)
VVELGVDGDRVSIAVDQLVICGFTGRNQADVQAHIEELGREGVPAPDSTPCFWQLSGELVSSASEIEVGSEKTSGEAEPVLVRVGDEWLVTVGSDHTDRALEREDILAAKATCQKPIASAAWSLGSVTGEWDAMELTSEVRLDGAWHPYQRATLEVLRPVDDLIEQASRQFALGPGTALFLGTPALLTSGFIFGDAYRIALHHGRSGRRLGHTYEISIGSRESPTGRTAR